MKEIQIGIHIDLPQDITQKIISVRKLTKRYVNSFLHPHITLGYIHYKKANFESLVKTLNNIKFISGEIKLGVVKKAKDRNKFFVYLSLRNKNIIINLHKQILPIINKYRGNLLRAKDIERLKSGNLSKQEKYYLKKYGNHRVLNNYNPHITLGELNKDELSRFNKIKKDLVNLQNRSIKITQYQVGLFEFDYEKGTFTNLKEETIGLN